jgi:hypothetical protein
LCWCSRRLQNAKVIVDDPYTKVALVNFGDFSLYKNGGPASQALVCLFGLLVIGVLSHFKIKGAVIFGILAATVLGLPLGVTDFNTLLGKTEGVTWKFWKNFSNYFCMDSSKGGIFFTIFTEGFAGFNKEIITTCVVTIISFCMIDMFDTMGTVVGCTTNAGLVDETGKPLNYDKIMYSDSIATCVGAVCGTSTVTTFVESCVGVAAGGKTGFTEIAKRTLVSTASKDNTNLVVVTLNDGNDWQDHQNLFEYGFNNYTNIELLKKGNINIYNEQYYEDYDLYVKNNFNYLIGNNEEDSVIFKYKLEKLRKIKNKDEVGKVEIYIGEEKIHEESIFIKEKEKEKKSVFLKFKEWIFSL